MTSFPSGWGYTILLLFCSLMLAVSWWLTRRRPFGLEGFMVADRRVTTWPAALSISGTWVWAPALFLASQKAYQQGAAGLFWFTFANVLCLIVFAPLALRIRRVFPEGYTLPQYIRKRHGDAVHSAYLFQFLALQVCSFAVQLLGGAAVVEILAGIPFAVAALILTVGVVAYSLLGGMRASVATDVIQMALILLVCAVIVPWSISSAGGWQAVTAGLGGVNGNLSDPFDAGVAYSFGIVVSLGLLAGPIGDQQHWQRAFAIQEGHVVRAFILGAILFALVPLSLSLLGFIGAGLAHDAGQGITDPQIVGPLVVAHLLPDGALLLFLVMLLAGLTSTMDSAMVAAGSMGGIDVFKERVTGGNGTDEKKILNASRWTILLIAVAGFAIAMLPGLKILDLFLFCGTLWAGTMIPAVLTLFLEYTNSRAIFIGVLTSWMVGLPGFIYAVLTGNVHLEVASTVFVVAFSGLCTLIGSKLWSNKAVVTVEPATAGSERNR